MGAPTHSLEDKERGLAALVIAGSSFRASEITGIPAQTLRVWKHREPERYAQLSKELGQQVKDSIAAEAESLVRLAAEREHAILEALDDKAIAELKPGELAGTLRNVTTSKALQVDKIIGPVREWPAHMNQGLNPDELVARMARTLGIDIINSTATETPNLALEAERNSPNAREAGPVDT